MPFGTTPFTRAHVSDLKSAIRDRYPEIKSSHVDEAIAFGFGFDTYAALLPVLIMADQTSCLTAQLVPDWFAVRLAQHGYDPMRYADLRHILWSSVPETRPAAKHRQEAARDMFRPRPANDS
ncbi:hypothetical protein [Devosia sediminis]|uniref:Uncharacterized protein n=1 Tax=Devosia sediminis TaxID=2798801 RepID=A0A934IWW6_9HYPH|nr:hypothetical protein [Devosia sediminis]MBJ3785857.1 hypothetical protein [Devosia sediminis]